MKKPNGPCYGCNEREIGCHSRCPYYLKYLEDSEAFRDKVNKAKAAERSLNIRVHDSLDRLKKLKGLDRK